MFIYLCIINKSIVWTLLIKPFFIYNFEDILASCKRGQIVFSKLRIVCIFKI